MTTVALIPNFIQDKLDLECLRQNRLTILDQLRNLADKGDLTVQETSILGFGAIASCTSSEDEVNIVLLRLVEYLGHPNPLVHGLAHEEVCTMP